MTRAYSPSTGELISEAHGPQLTAYEYYPSPHPSAGRLKVTTDPSGKKVYFNYNSRGDVVQTWGDTTYPMEIVFDAYGQKTELHTFRSGSGWQDTSWPTATVGAVDVTRWTYQDATGLITAKHDAANKQVLYTYDLLGRVATRRWARLTGGGNPIITTYSYDPNSGEMTGVSYSDSTQPVTLTYDRGGRQATVTDAAGTHTLRTMLRDNCYQTRSPGVRLTRSVSRLVTTLSCGAIRCKAHAMLQLCWRCIGQCKLANQFQQRFD